MPLFPVPEEPAVRNERTASRRAAAWFELRVADALRDALARSSRALLRERSPAGRDVEGPPPGSNCGWRTPLRDALARSSRALLRERSREGRGATASRSNRSLRSRPRGTSIASHPVPEELSVRDERAASRRAAATVQRRKRACCFHTRTVWPGCNGGENSDQPRGSSRISHWASGGLFGSGSTW